eukprot:s835_g18.t1
MLGLAAAVVIALLLLGAYLALRPPRWPFKVLKRSGLHRCRKWEHRLCRGSHIGRGSFKSSGLPVDGNALEERKRDFMRTKPGLLARREAVVTPTASDPSSWSSALPSGDLNKEKLDATFQELLRPALVFGCFLVDAKSIRKL